ncbi:MAG: hypothetical protein AB7F32_05230 [Victivallaceae bacterium]
MGKLLPLERFHIYLLPVMLLTLGILPATAAASADDDFLILIHSGSGLSAYCQEDRRFYPIRDHVVELSISSRGDLIFKDDNGDIHFGRVRSDGRLARIEEEIKVSAKLIDSDDRAVISDDGKVIVAYRPRRLRVFQFKAGTLVKTSEVAVKGDLACPAISHDNTRVAFYHRERPKDGYTLSCLDIVTGSFRPLNREKIVPISLSGAWTLPPRWNRKDQYITVENGASHPGQSVVSLLRVKDGKTLPSSSYLWADANHLAVFACEHGKLLYSSSDVDSQFEETAAAKPSATEVPLADFQGFEVIASRQNGADYVFQDVHGNFYHYQSPTARLTTLGRTENMPARIFLVERPL